MGRRRAVNVQLPEGVQTVRKSGKAYYYWAPKRSTKHAGERVALGSDPSDPRFWKALRDAKGGLILDGSFDSLIDTFKTSPEWSRLRKATQDDYTSYLDRLSAESGDRLVSLLTRKDVYLLRDAMAETPVAANHMLSILQTIVEWGIVRGYSEDNPVVAVKRLTTDDNGATPWPAEGYALVLARAPTDLMRMAVLGRATGQRASDLVRMKPAHMEADGINVWIGKRREKKHFVPLTKEQVATITSWGVDDMDWFIKSTRGKNYSADHLNSRWNWWRGREEAAPLLNMKMTIHGLKATAIEDRRAQGAADGAIADELGMSVAMVHRYSRFADKKELAKKSRDRREAEVFKLSERSRNVAASSSAE